MQVYPARARGASGDCQSARGVPEAEWPAEVRRIGAEVRRPFYFSSMARSSVLSWSSSSPTITCSSWRCTTSSPTPGRWACSARDCCLYRSFVTAGAGRGADLPELTLQFADYAACSGSLSGGALEQQLSDWTKRLQGAPAALDVPADCPRPPVPSHRGEKKSFSISPELGKALRDLPGRRA